MKDGLYFVSFLLIMFTAMVIESSVRVAIGSLIIAISLIAICECGGGKYV